MQVLLLSRGDAAAKDLLRRALAARYGYGAPALETLKLIFKGRARLKVSRLATWVPLEATVYFRFPLTARWEYTLRPAGMPINVGIHAFDGRHYRHKLGMNVETVNETGIRQAMRDRVWALALIMLSPLTEPEIELRRESERTLVVTRLDTGTCVRVMLNEDYTLEHLEFQTLETDSMQIKQYRLNFDSQQQQIGVGNFALPSRFSMLWDNDPRFELSPVAAVLNPPLEDSLFRLEDD